MFEFKISRIRAISIHTLHAESDDRKGEHAKTCGFISIHTLHAESDIQFPCGYAICMISIHTLHAESDRCGHSPGPHIFISIHTLHAESDVIPPIFRRSTGRFQSTLSMRRVTAILSKTTPCFSDKITKLFLILLTYDFSSAL